VSKNPGREFTKHDGLINRIIRKKRARLASCCWNDADLVRVGREAAMVAETSHVPDRLPLGTWVGIIVEQRIDEAISQAGPISRYYWIMVTVVRAAKIRFQERSGGSTPTIVDIENMTGLSSRQIEDVQRIESALGALSAEDLTDEVESIVDRGIDVEDSATTAVLAEAIWSHMEMLVRTRRITQDELDIMREYFLCGKNTVKIAAEMDISVSGTSSIIRRVVEIVQASGFVDDPEVATRAKSIRCLEPACKFRGISKRRRPSVCPAKVGSDRSTSNPGEKIVPIRSSIFSTKVRTPTRIISPSEVDPRNPFSPDFRMHGYFQAFLDGDGTATYGDLIRRCVEMSERFVINDCIESIRRDLNNQTWNWQRGKWGLLVTKDDSMCQKTTGGHIIKSDRDKVTFTCIEVQGRPWSDVSLAA